MLLIRITRYLKWITVDRHSMVKVIWVTCTSDSSHYICTLCCDQTSRYNSKGRKNGLPWTLCVCNHLYNSSVIQRQEHVGHWWNLVLLQIIYGFAKKNKKKSQFDVSVLPSVAEATVDLVWPIPALLTASVIRVTVTQVEVRGPL